MIIMGLFQKFKDMFASKKQREEEIEEILEESTEEEEETITMAGIMARGKWFVGLAGASTAGAGVVALEAKRRAAIKLLDKLNQ